MPGAQIDLNPVALVAVGAIGRPGSRVFYLQASDGETMVTVKLEKEQVLGLSRAVELLFNELESKEVFSHVANDDPSVSGGPLREPVEPDFAVASIQLGHDESAQLLVLFLEAEQEGESEEAPRLRLWLRPQQLRAVGAQARDLAAKGRATCPLCHRPIDPDGHFCPGGNGHGRKVYED